MTIDGGDKTTAEESSVKTTVQVLTQLSVLVGAVSAVVNSVTSPRKQNALIAGASAVKLRVRVAPSLYKRHNTGLGGRLAQQSCTREKLDIGGHTQS